MGGARKPRPQAQGVCPRPQRLLKKKMSTFDLFSSVRDGNADIVRRLLQYKARRQHLNDRNEWGDTALHLSAEAGNGKRFEDRCVCVGGGGG